MTDVTNVTNAMIGVWADWRSRWDFVGSAPWQRTVALRPLLSLVHVLLPLLPAVLGALGWFHDRRPAYASPANLATLAEPPAAAAFMAAYARGDEATAERLASPLYRAEWARRGVSVQDRLALLPHWFTKSARSPGAVWLRFTYAGGVTDAEGVLHLLYTARCVCPDQRGPSQPTVWRVDTDSSGRVMWLEMVWLFDERTQRVRPVAADRPAGALPLPPALAASQPQVALGVEAGDGREGYYALRLGNVSSELTGQAPMLGTLLFLGVDRDGRARPGAWSYGAATVSRNAPPAS